MAQTGHGFSFSQEPLQLFRPGVRAGEKHFERDGIPTWRT
jgi:hypothetical protein